MNEQIQTLLRGLPKIDEILLILEKRNVEGRAPREVVRAACREAVEDLRRSILSRKGDAGKMRLPLATEIADLVERRMDALHRPRLKRVINATGVILHTNLGRAPLCREARDQLLSVAEGYSNLEYDLARGERGKRYDAVRELLCLLAGVEDALVVNNNAAAVLLALNTLAEGREVIVSRGELVEIGGEFRVPEIMEKSGGRLREVGATNRTRLADYERAISPETGLILKVHSSNFKMVGFTEETSLEELVALGKKHSLPVMYDVGSGCFLDLAEYGLPGEPVVREVAASGVDVLTFSGDKMLGGAQAGIILGRRNLLEKIQRNPLNRALRIDKLTLAAMEATLRVYLNPKEAVNRLRILKALTEPLNDVTRRARKLLGMLKRALPTSFSLALRPGASMVGGGALPGMEIQTTMVGIRMSGFSAGRLEERLRRLDVPIIVRVANNELLLDLRTIAEDELKLIREGLLALAENA
ncbi:L-seryl-tRNA(Sec) selenium transferase [Syntrophus gentianae]|uniref:L-seryl-tRNA(Sec) selenium transferase n=1 Tax=Syntrophus gentianae TaxID=43775 RepID=A0A1H7UI07_9BACT|nr:L-seryl-tRNA(Sec) selenium transferase [Syntrophus gentianae]SEL95887.1 L-seryl-tRNA(Sec) selenium transferase [Syntrophus gentianae]